MDYIDKHKLMGTLVGGFFEGFATGVMDCSDGAPADRFEPKAVKRAMVEHYEHIADAFNATLFYPIASLNYSFEEMEHELRQTDMSRATMGDLLRMACRTEDFFRDVIDEYKRNFTMLLQGRRLRGTALADGDGGERVETGRAIAATVRTVMTAYTKGIGQAGGGHDKIRQTSVIRLVLEAMATLLGDGSIPTDGGDDLHEVFLKVCGSQENFEAMTEEMDRTFAELSAE